MQQRVMRPQRRSPSGVLVAVVAVAMVFSGAGSSSGSTTDPNPGPLELANAAVSKRAATQGMVLLENHGDALPMPKTGNVALFGVGMYKTVKGGTGSGDLNNRYTVSVQDGFKNAGYSITTSPVYYNAMVSLYEQESKKARLINSDNPRIDYASAEYPLTADLVKPTSPTDTAIFVLARNSGEGEDRSSGAGDYLINKVERANLQLLGQNYQRVVVVLNVGGVVDTTFMDQINATTKDPVGGTALDSLLLMSQGGQESGNALVEVLAGAVTPSGKLTDTWASSYLTYPASPSFGNNDSKTDDEYYTEGIYVGYRYFDSKYKTINPGQPQQTIGLLGSGQNEVDVTRPLGGVRYPFGYGLSYSNFTVATVGVVADMRWVSVMAKVTNAGSTHAGKEVVQVYFSAPQTGLDKPYQELAGYAKTDNLAPGESQLVTIRFSTTEMSSYDESKAAYTMEGGDYLIRVGNSSRSTVVAAKVRLAQTVTTERLANELTNQKPSSELTSSPADFYNYPSETQQAALAPVVTLNTADFAAPDRSSPYRESVAVDPSSPFFKVAGEKISTTTALIAADSATNWNNTRKPYQPKLGETIKTVTTNKKWTLFDVAKGNVTMDQFVAGFNPGDLATIMGGTNGVETPPEAHGSAGFTTGKYTALGVPPMSLADGPAGLRLTQKIPLKDSAGGNTQKYQFATAWPIGTMLAQTWDRNLLTEVGRAIGAELAEYRVSLWLAPGMNIHRDPLGGRNFEYYSEDPLVSGLAAAATTEGVQRTPGVGVTIKHFFGNNQETNREQTNSVIGERASREIYLKGFEIAVKTAQPMAVMSSYNLVNGSYTSADYELLTDILRGEWGFKGIVVSDWLAGDRTGVSAPCYAGNDLAMPEQYRDKIVKQLSTDLRLGDLQRNAGRVLNLAMQTAEFGMLAAKLKVDGIEVKGFTAEFPELSYLESSLSDLSKPSHAP